MAAAAPCGNSSTRTSPPTFSAATFTKRRGWSSRWARRGRRTWGRRATFSIYSEEQQKNHERGRRHHCIRLARQRESERQRSAEQRRHDFGAGQLGIENRQQEGQQE